MDSSTRRKHCFIEEEEEEEDDGGQAASLTDMEAGVSGNHHPFFNRMTSFLRYRTVSYRSSTSSSSLRNLSLSNVSSPRSARFYDGRFEEHQPHFLESCSLCKKPLGDNRDIFMYRGDTPFCSEECREEQMDIDEAKEKNWNLSSSMKALRKKDQNKSTTSPTKTRNYPFRTGTVAAA